MKTYNTEFGDIIITFIDGNVRPLEMEGKVDFGYIIITFNDQNGRPLEIEGKVHNEKMKWSEWFIRRSIFCQEEYKIQNSMLRSIFCDYRDTYLVGRDSKTVTRNDNAGRKKKCQSSKIMLHLGHAYHKFIGNVTDLDIVMLMYYLQEYSDNYFMTSGIL